MAFKGVTPGGRSRSMRLEQARRKGRRTSTSPRRGVWGKLSVFPACQDFLLLDTLSPPSDLFQFLFQGVNDLAILMVATRPHTPRCFQGYRLFRFGCALMGSFVSLCRHRPLGSLNGLELKMSKSYGRTLQFSQKFRTFAAGNCSYRALICHASMTIRPRVVYRPPLDTPRTARMAVTIIRFTHGKTNDGDQHFQDCQSVTGLAHPSTSRLSEKTASPSCSLSTTRSHPFSSVGSSASMKGIRQLSPQRRVCTRNRSRRAKSRW